MTISTRFLPQGPLYFGTAKHPAKNRLRWGIQPRKKQLLCAFTDLESAWRYASSFGPHARVITIDAVRLAERGYAFDRHEDNLIVLRDKITPKYLSYANVEADVLKPSG